MGEIADDMIDGMFCSHCGALVGEGDRFPVLCGTCYNRDRGRSEIPRAASEPTENKKQENQSGKSKA